MPRLYAEQTARFLLPTDVGVVNRLFWRKSLRMPQRSWKEQAMKLGFAVPSIGQVATPEAALAVAQRAEELGYHSLWTVERLL